MKLTSALSVLTLSSVVLCHSFHPPPKTYQPNLSANHPAGAINPHARLVKKGKESIEVEQVEKRSSANDSASELGNALEYLVCLLGGEARAAAQSMGLNISAQESCASLVAKSPSAGKGLISAVGGADEMFTMNSPQPTSQISSAAIAFPVSSASSTITIVASSNSALPTTTAAVVTLSIEDSDPTEGSENTSTYAGGEVATFSVEDFTRTATALDAPASVTNLVRLNAVTGVIKIDIIGDTKSYYYPKDLSSTATSDLTSAAVFSISTLSGKCSESTTFDLASLDYPSVASKTTYLGATLEAKKFFQVMDGAPLGPLSYNSGVPFSISQPHNHYATRTFETTLWSIEDCHSTTPYLSASWNSANDQIGIQNLLICANADSKETVAPSDFFLSFKPEGNCGSEWNSTTPATKVQVNFTFIPSAGSSFYPSN